MLKSLLLMKECIMLKLFMGWVIIALLVGCSSKEEQALLSAYTQKSQYHKHLQRTEKAELHDANSSVALITATHLYTPSHDKNDTSDEVFIIGVQFEDSDNSKMLFDKSSTFDKDKNITLTNENEYILTLNKKKASKVVPLPNDDKRLKKLSFITQWVDYYEVTFPHTGSRFSLEFANAYYGKKALRFSKLPKFVYTKKGF